jgi:SAM-dependent methyltransferase
VLSGAAHPCCSTDLSLPPAAADGAGHERVHCYLPGLTAGTSPDAVHTVEVDGFGASTYGEGFAEVYDRWYHDVTDTAACVDRLVELAGAAGATVLELGIGTGRLALPLADRGLAVTGVDASVAMVDRLAAKPGADRIAVVVGDMARLDELLPLSDHRPGYDLVLAAYNTLFNLPSVEAQQACLAAVVERLGPSGRLVVEGFVPIDDEAGRRDDVAISRMSASELVLAATVHDREAQTIVGQHVEITEAGVKLRPWLVRYLRPGQLDDLAGSVGLHLEQRWAGWHREPFDDTSSVHVSVYRRTP